MEGALERGYRNADGSIIRLTKSEMNKGAITRVINTLKANAASVELHDDILVFDTDTRSTWAVLLPASAE